ncbi:ABC transporter permease [Streptomyces sp. NPDC101160]|uniref:ABC transporter permease n=1 Tax=Streptomyces sp. NPDC101160 TaxID=3366118 RepID=UPI0038276E83
MAFHTLHHHDPGTLRPRFWAEVVLGSISALLFLVTLVWRDWIEVLFGVEPDAGSGALEWLIVAVTALVAVLCALGARMEWRRTRSAGAHASR